MRSSTELKVYIKILLLKVAPNKSHTEQKIIFAAQSNNEKTVLWHKKLLVARMYLTKNSSFKRKILFWRYIFTQIFFEKSCKLLEWLNNLSPNSPNTKSFGKRSGNPDFQGSHFCFSWLLLFGLLGSIYTCHRKFAIRELDIYYH